MKKILRLLTVASAALIANTATAQIDGNTNSAPDFQLHDTDGNPHNLYTDYLDNNIPVVLDVMAHWCPPCWTYSVGGTLEDVYDQYGPTGTTSVNDVMVFMADGDATSTYAELYNTGLSGGQATQGNWMAITGYPVFGGDTGIGLNDGRTIANLYQINYFPTIFLVCPDRTVKEIGQLQSVTAIMNEVNACNSASTTTNDGQLYYIEPVPNNCPGGNLSIDFQVKNMGSSTMTSAEIEVVYDNTPIDTISWTGSLSQYSMTAMSKTFNTVESGAHKVDFKIISVNGGADDLATNNIASVDFALESEEDDYTITINTDSYGNETSWYIKDSQGNKVFQKNDFQTGNYGNNGSFSHNFTLDTNDCYKLTVTDSYDDGIPNGGVTIKDANNALVVSVSGDFESSINGSWARYVQVIDPNASISELKNGSVSVFPNPIVNVANIVLDLTINSNVKVELTNILGEVVYSENLGTVIGNKTVQVNTENLTKGAYMMNVYVGNETISQKLVK